MIQKLLLTILLVMVAVLLFLTNKISHKIGNMASMDSMDIQAISPTPAATFEPKQPMIWDLLKDRTIKKIYLSYDNQDFQTAKDIAKLLEKDGLISVYFAPNIREVSNYKALKSDEESLRALNTMDAFAILYSPTYFQNQINIQEYGIANSKQAKTIILTKVAVDPSLQSEAVLQFSPETEANMQQNFINLLNSEIDKDIKNF